MASLSEVIDLYLADRRARGFGAATIRSERHTLRLLLADIGNISPNRLRPQHLDIYWQKRTTWGPGSMNKARAQLSSFFGWCRIRGHMPRDLDPLAGSRKIRVPKRDRVLIPQAEFESFIEGTENPRTRIAVALGLYLFLRISETQVLRWRDLDLDAGVAQVVRLKTGTIDTLPICNELAAEIRRWRMTYAARVGQQPAAGWYVVPGHAPHGDAKGKKGHRGFYEMEPRPYLPDVRSTLSHAISDRLKEAGYYQLQEGGHTLRRSGATALYNQLTSVGHDRSIRICQAMLGHNSVQTTEIYLRLDLDRKVRNDLLAGKRMFPEVGTAQVLRLTEGSAQRGQEDAGVV